MSQSRTAMPSAVRNATIAFGTMTYKLKPGYRYQIERNSVWFPKDRSVNLEEMPTFLEDNRDDDDPNYESQEPPYEEYEQKSLLF